MVCVSLGCTAWVGEMLFSVLLLFGRLFVHLGGDDHALGSQGFYHGTDHNDGFAWEKLPMDRDSYTTSTGIELRREAGHVQVASTNFDRRDSPRFLRSDVTGSGSRRRWFAGKTERDLSSSGTVTAEEDKGTSGNSSVVCNSGATCGSSWGGGNCENSTANNSHCVCNTGWYTLSESTKTTFEHVISDREKKVCGYKQMPKLLILLLSIFLGGCGVDRCILARFDGCAICLGICKGVTVGACGIWYVVDVILISMDMLPDALNIPLDYSS